MRTLCKTLTLFVLLMTAFISAHAQNFVYAMKDGKVVFKEEASKVGQIVWNETNTEVTIYTTTGVVYQTFLATEVDSVTTQYNRPVADILDIHFGADGSVSDLSEMRNSVTVVSPANNGKVPVYYSPTYKTYVAQLWNDYGKGSAGDTGPSYCKIDYADNEAFLNALKAGHTLECLFRLNYPEDGMANVEIKPFSSHQSGGTGIMICTKTRGLNKTNEITFLPNVNKAYKWAVSGITPQDSVYYHVVGVWDKDAKKARIYVNGELKNTVDASGELTLSSVKWFGIGCDPYSNESGEAGAHFDIVNTRIYSQALDDESVSILWNEMAGLKQTDPVVVPSISNDEPIDTTTVETPSILLDVQFNSDGTAFDASPMQMKVETINNGGVSTYYNNTYKRFVASFDNPWGGTPTGYYKVDYESNQSFKDALADGHTLECLIMPTFSNLTNTEVKPFASHQAGGTGFLLCYPGEGSATSNEFTFLPNVSPSGSSSWRWATSGVQPESNKYYHLIGVWNKEKGVAEIYVDGQLKNSVSAPGALRFPSSGSNWFAIGCDAASGTGTNAWNGNIVMARVYNDVMTKTDVDSLWAIVKEMQDQQVPDMITDYSFLSGLTVTTGFDFPIKGKGFEEGDVVRLVSTTSETTYACNTSLSDEGAKMTICDDLQSGTYRLNVIRGEQMQDLGICTFVVADQFPQGAQVIAHRGYWTKDGGTAQNSRQSLINAVEGNYYGSETDVWITADGKVVANHNASISNVTIQTSTFDQLSGVRLSNGETIPTLDDFLDIINNSDSQTKLIIEIKTHSNSQRGFACCDSVVNAVKRSGLQDKVEYIAYSLAYCRRLVMNDSTAMVQYLNGDKSPEDLNAIGIHGLDYTKAQLISNNWIERAAGLGLVTNAYTIDSPSEMAEVNSLGINFITTNYPEQAQEIYEFYRDNQPQTESEARKALVEYTEQVKADTTNYDSEIYDRNSVEAFKAALDRAQMVIEENSSADEEYTSVLQELKNAYENIALAPVTGDVNEDGQINSADVVAVYYYINGGDESGILFERANVNADDIVNSADIVCLYNIIQGQPTP